MKLHLLTTLLILALPALAQSQAHPTSASEWQRQQIQQREMDRQRQHLDQQRQALALLQAQQRRAERDASYSEPVVIVPVVPRRVTVTVTPQNRTAVNSYIARVMADKTLNLDQKLRLIDGVLGAPRP